MKEYKDVEKNVFITYDGIEATITTTATMKKQEQKIGS